MGKKDDGGRERKKGFRLHHTISSVVESVVVAKPFAQKEIVRRAHKGLLHGVCVSERVHDLLRFRTNEPLLRPSSADRGDDGQKIGSAA